MSDSTSYSVLSGGKLRPDFEPEQVRNSVAALFKIPLEKAELLLTRQQVIKKQVDLKTAQIYKQKLESIGLAVTLREHKPPTIETSALSLTPVDDTPEAAAAPDVVTNTHDPEPSGSNSVRCPKCGRQQPAGTSECRGCGVFLQKVPHPVDDVAPTRLSDEPHTEDDSADSVTPRLVPVSLLAGAGAALAGALLWSFIANTFGYELGLVAWGIGGLVGFAFAATGSSGSSAGTAAAILALVAILGGKYLLYSGVEDDISEAIASSQDEMKQLYIDEMVAAVAYKDVSDEHALRRFMVHHKYVEYDDPGDVSAEEIASFKEVDVPRLQSFGLAQPAYEQWYQETVGESLAGISTVGLIKADFGFMDAIFLLLGVATAFRLGYGRQEE